MAYLTAIEMFGLPGVSNATDLTSLQLRFLHSAYWLREELRTPEFDE